MVPKGVYRAVMRPPANKAGKTYTFVFKDIQVYELKVEAPNAKAAIAKVSRWERTDCGTLVAGQAPGIRARMVNTERDWDIGPLPEGG